MRPFRKVLVPLFALTLLMTLPAAGEEAELREETAWFTCAGTTPDYQANYRLGDDTPTWAGEEPTGAFPEDQCGSAHQSLFGGTEQESPYDLSFAGYFEGQLDTITVHLHNAYLGTNRDTGADQTLDVRVTIDELSVFGIQEFTGTDVDGLTFETITHTGPAPRPLRVKPEPSDNGFSEIFTFHITGIDYLTEEDAGPHRIVLTIATGLNGGNAQNVWAWGTQETPSSITFNDPDATSDRWNTAIPREDREEHHYPE